MLRRFRMGIMPMVMILLVGGCAGKPSQPVQVGAGTAPVQSQSLPQSKSKEIMEVTIATGERSSFIYFPMFIAEQLGHFEEEGLKVTFSEQKGGSQVAQALVAGQADFGSTVTEHAPKYASQGVSLKVVSLYTRLPSSALVVDSRHAESIKSVKDLKGKMVGVTSPGSGSHQSLLAMLKKEGLNEADVTVIGVGFDMGQAFKDEKVVAGVTYDPYITMVTEGKMGQILQYDLRLEKDTKALFGTEYPFGALLTRAEVIEQNPELVRRVVSAVSRANKWIASRSAAEISAVVPKQYKADEALYIKAVENVKPTISPDGRVSLEGVESVITVLEGLGVVAKSANVKAADVVDMRFVEEAASKN